MRFPEPQRTEIDGIPVWFTDVPGPCLAGLVFRVGRCDETLPVSGITHMVEHLALYPLAPTRLDMNGTVGLLTTTFNVAGTQAGVAIWLAIALICADNALDPGAAPWPPCLAQLSSSWTSSCSSPRH